MSIIFRMCPRMSNVVGEGEVSLGRRDAAGKGGEVGDGGVGHWGRGGRGRFWRGLSHGGSEFTIDCFHQIAKYIDYFTKKDFFIMTRPV